MGWNEQVFAYCERGVDPAFWAEPLNAASNAAFLAAAVAAGTRLRRLHRAGDLTAGPRLWLAGLIGLVAAIGGGSFAFHTFATRWAMLADVGPITVFMLAYLAYALRTFLAAGWAVVAGALIVFLAVGQLAAGITCAVPGDAPGLVREPCLNGSLGYAPALAALVVVGLLVLRRGQEGHLLLAAAAVFLVSVTLRTLDRSFCPTTVWLGLPRGTHLFWHLLNALMLYLLLVAALRCHEVDRGERAAKA